MVDWGAYFAVAALGIVFGASELVSRHPDQPLMALRVSWGIFYMALNALFSIVALYILDVARVDWIAWPTAEGQSLASVPLEWIKAVLLAAFGSAAVFRSGIMKVKGPNGEGELTIGPGAVVDVFLNMADAAVDRTLGATRIDHASTTMAGVDFDSAKAVLPPYCFGALRRVSADQQAAFAHQLASLDKAPADKATKSELLALALTAVVGPDIVAKAVKGLGNRIRTPPPAPP